MDKIIACIDLKAFYSSVECVERNLDPFTTPLVVCDTERGMGTIILSVTPYCKSLGIPSRLRRRELPHIKGMIYATPRMELYMHKSCEVMSTILDFVSEDDLHIYSVDECFINLGPYLTYYNKTADELVAMIQKEIYDRLGLVSTAGISYNIFMAKAALDLDGKNRAPYYRATWTHDDVQNKLWKVKPINKVWGIAQGYTKRLEELGIDSIEKLAKTPKDYLKFKFGVIGEQLHDLANGIDNSDIREKYIPMATSFSVGHTLHEDYSLEDAKLLIRELNDDICKRLHINKKTTKLVTLTVLYNYNAAVPGFSKQVTLDSATDNNDLLYRTLIEIFNDHAQDFGVRKVYISFGKLKTTEYLYQSLFEDDIDATIENRDVNLVVEKIQEKYGLESIARTSSLLKKSNYKLRANQIGGHRK